MTHLITAPTITFNQSNDDGYETPTQVSYYNGTIELRQDDNSIIIQEGFVKSHFKEIIKHEPRAKEWLLRNT